MTRNNPEPSPGPLSLQTPRRSVMPSPSPMMPQSLLPVAPQWETSKPNEEIEDNGSKEENDDDNDVCVRRYEDVVIQDIKFNCVKKSNNIYFVPFKSPLLVKTPVVRVNEITDKTTLKITNGLALFVKHLEQYIEDAAVSNKSEWFRTRISNEAIKKSYKSFLVKNLLKVKTSDELAVFDAHGKYIEDDICCPTNARCLLEMTGICFGRMEFGVMFTVTQLQLTDQPECKIYHGEMSISNEFE